MKILQIEPVPGGRGARLTAGCYTDMKCQTVSHFTRNGYVWSNNSLAHKIIRNASIELSSTLQIHKVLKKSTPPGSLFIVVQPINILKNTYEIGNLAHLDTTKAFKTMGLRNSSHLYEKTRNTRGDRPALVRFTHGCKKRRHRRLWLL